MCLLCAFGCAARAPAPAGIEQIDALRAELQSELRTLRASQSDALRQQAAESTARNAALRAELKALGKQLADLRAALGPPRVVGGAAPSQGKTESKAKTEPTQRVATKRPRRKRAKPTPDPPVPMSRSEEVRALMASVAAQLQSASEAKGGQVPRDRQRRARESLVKADRAAALSLWERAQELALAARATLDGKQVGAAVNTPGDLEALMRDAEQLFPGRVRAVGHGLAVSLPIKRGHGAEVPVDRRSLSHIGRLARVYDGMRLSVQFREPTPDRDRAEQAYEAVRRLLMERARVSDGRIQPGSPLTAAAAVRDSAGHLVIGFSTPSP